MLKPTFGLLPLLSVDNANRATYSEVAHTGHVPEPPHGLPASVHAPEAVVVAPGPVGRGHGSEEEEDRRREEDEDEAEDGHGALLLGERCDGRPAVGVGGGLCGGGGYGDLNDAAAIGAVDDVNV